MTNYLELEISLHRRDFASYKVELRFRDPNDEAEQRAEAFPVRFDLDRLRERIIDPGDYGVELGQMLLGNADVRVCFEKARGAAQASQRRLRLRLCLDRLSADLHALRWETLCEPVTRRRLALDDNLLFSRHLGSFDMRPVRLRVKSDLRTLIAVANPVDLEEWNPGHRALHPIDVPGELRRARERLPGIRQIEELEGRPRVSLDAIVARLRDEYDIMYLVCHGALIDGEPRLWLEGEDGRSRVTSGVELVDALARLLRLPRLVVLASCQSAGTGDEATSEDEGALAALGPRLAEAGIPAVIAMQGNVQQRTVARFMPKFFEELLADGQIDRAMSEARFAVRDHVDWWAPVLYTRLVNGRLWYESRLSGGQVFQPWRGIVDQIENRGCIPILGPGLLEPYVGGMRDLGHEWGREHGYPLTSLWVHDVPQVAQYLRAVQGPDYPKSNFVKRLTGKVLERWPSLKDAAEAQPGKGRSPGERLAALLSAARERAVAERRLEAHDVLARLDCPIFLTANADNLLLDALRKADKQPWEDVFKWRASGGLEEKTAGDGGGPPAVSRQKASVPAPLVYRMFGRFEDRDSLVLTEDDYFEYLIRISRIENWPKQLDLSIALPQSSLMFLGFRVDDWSFRVFLHCLNNMPSRRLLREKLHVSVQVDPDEGLGADPTTTRRFLEKYFHASWTNFEVYWGSVEDFLQELDRQWRTKP
jgi:hypothetical protein